MNVSKLEQVRDILEEHRGKKNKITSAKIAKMIDIDEDDTHSKSRRLIEDAIEEYGLPVAADSRGYFMIETEDELEEYMENLDARIDGIKDRKKVVTKNFRKKHK